MTIRAYKVASDGTQSIVELEVSENWYLGPEEPDSGVSAHAEAVKTKAQAAEEIRTVSIIQSKNAASASKTK